MSEKYDLSQMLKEIKEDEQLSSSQSQQLTQEEIQRLTAQKALERRRSKKRA